jgi:hypothetical protein
MTLQQLSTLRRWHADHQRRCPVEYQAWETVLTLWVLGGVGLPVSVLLERPATAAACLAALVTPRLYVALRRLLHRRRWLRCDWLSAGEPGR